MEEWYPSKEKQPEPAMFFDMTVERVLDAFVRSLPFNLQETIKPLWEKWLGLKPDHIRMITADNIKEYVRRWLEIQRLPIDEQVRLGGEWYVNRHYPDDMLSEAVKPKGETTKRSEVRSNDEK